MTPESTLSIRLEYQLNSEQGWHSVELTPEQFFDLEPGETVNLDSLPKYSHAIEYLENIEPEDIAATKILLIDEGADAKRSIIEKFWNEGRNRIIERTDLGSEPYWEIIVETQVSPEPPLWEILRIGRENGVVKPWYHAFLQDNEDGSQTEIRVDSEGAVSR